MNAHQSNAIQRLWSKLSVSMPTNYVADKLVEKKIISIADLDEMNKSFTPREKNQAMLKQIINCPSKTVYNDFVEILQSIPTKSKCLADDIKEAYKQVLLENGISSASTCTESTDNNNFTEDDWIDCLQYIAQNLGRDWKMLGRRLRMKETIITDCETDNRNNVAEARYSMLYQWNEQCNDPDPSSRLDTLIKALKASELKRLAEDVANKAWKDKK